MIFLILHEQTTNTFTHFFQQLTNKLLKSNGFVNNFLFQQLERHRVIGKDNHRIKGCERLGSTCGTIGRMLTCYVDLTGTKFAKYHHKNKFTVIIII
jgi:hypothetical protein